MDFKPFHNSFQKRRLLVKSWKDWKNLYWDYDRWNWTYNTISGQIDGIHRFKGHAICVQAQTFNEELLRFEIQLKHIRNINRSKFHHFNMLLKFPHYETSFGWNHLIFGSFGKIFSWQEHQSHQSTCITCTLNSSHRIHSITFIDFNCICAPLLQCFYSVIVSQFLYFIALICVLSVFIGSHNAYSIDFIINFNGEWVRNNWGKCRFMLLYGRFRL